MRLWRTGFSNLKVDSPEKRVAQTRVFLRDGYNQVQEPMGL